MSLNNVNPEPSLLNLIISDHHLVRTGFQNKYDGLVFETVHNIYLDLNTNRLIFQRDKGNLEFDFSLSNLPDVNSTNATSGSTLLFNGTNWDILNSNQLFTYSNNNQSTRFQDIKSVSSITNAIDKILYPFILPTFTNFYIQSSPLTFELGQYFSTSGQHKTFSWLLSTPNNISGTSGYKLLDITNSFTLANNITPISTTSSLINIPYNITKTINNSTNIFQIKGKDKQNNFFQKNLTLTWKPRIYFGNSSISIALNSAQIISLSSSTSGGSKLVTDIVNSFKLNGDGRYIWLALPVSFGKAINSDGSSSRFIVNGFSNSYWNLYTVNFTNQFGFTSQYYLYRSVSKMFGTNINIEII